MQIKPDCIPCILKMSMSAIRTLPLDEDKVKQLCCDILQIPSLRGEIWEITSPEIIELVLKKMVSATNIHDPFSSVKSEQNSKMTERYAFLKALADDSDDPLYATIHLAIIGNSIDMMMSDDKRAVEDSMAERLKTDSLPEKAYSQFKSQLRASRRVVYFGDNSGEIVLDKLLIETIKKQYNIDVVFVVRSLPALNDVTLKEAMAVGMDKVARVVENGTDGPMPGTVLSRCSEEVNHLVSEADLIISKGGGNFDTLEEEVTHLRNNITFMLLSKCWPIYNYFGIKLYQPILANFFN